MSRNVERHSYANTRTSSEPLVGGANVTTKCSGIVAGTKNQNSTRRNTCGTLCTWEHHVEPTGYIQLKVRLTSVMYCRDMCLLRQVYFETVHSSHTQQLLLCFNYVRVFVVYIAYVLQAEMEDGLDQIRARYRIFNDLSHQSKKK
jgi:hypothetical protein